MLKWAVSDTLKRAGHDNATNNDIPIGNENNYTNNRAFIRFTNVAIPQGVVIASARIRLRSFSTRTGTVVVRIKQEPTFLSVSIPGAAQADEISARPNGQMIIHMAYIVPGVEMHREEIVRADLETIDIHEGGTSSSIVLSGHKTIDWGSPKTVPLPGVFYRGNGFPRTRFSQTSTSICRIRTRTMIS